MCLRKLLIGIGAAVGLTAAAGAAQAQSPNGPCVTVTPLPYVVPITIDPFGGAPGGVITITGATFTATRNPDPYGSAYSGEKISEANFVFLQPVGDTTNYGVVWTYNGDDVLQPQGYVVVNNNSNDQIYLNFGGGNSALNFTLNFTIPLDSVQPGQNLLSLDMSYMCKVTGGGNPPDIVSTYPDALQIQFTIATALQASFAGPALDFGEVGEVSDAQAPSHTESGFINVRSSAPYSVSVTTDNTYRMTAGGGPPGPANQIIGYDLVMLGQTRNVGTGSFVTVGCASAGLGAGDSIPISTTLNQGGQGKLVANYSDTVNVTFTPDVNTPGPLQNCG